jgi:hypothetical protein
MTFLEQVLAETPGLTSRELVPRVQAAFGLMVHARSIERARARRSKNLPSPQQP